MRGFTLLELILVIGILAILGTVGFNFYFNFQVDVKVDEEINRIQQILRQVQQKAVSGEKREQSGGIRFTNNTANDQHYDVFGETVFQPALPRIFIICLRALFYDSFFQFDFRRDF